MIPWMDAIEKLRFHGYSVTLIEGRLRYTYQGKGNPPQDEIIPLLEVLKANKAEILKDPCFLINQTIQAINEHWKAGTLERLSQEVRERVRTIEVEINRLALAKDIDGLRKSLEAYKGIFLTIQQPFLQSQGGLNLGARKQVGRTFNGF